LLIEPTPGQRKFTKGGKRQPKKKKRPWRGAKVTVVVNSGEAGGNSRTKIQKRDARRSPQREIPGFLPTNAQERH